VVCRIILLNVDIFSLVNGQMFRLGVSVCYMWCEFMVIEEVGPISLVALSTLRTKLIVT
jgi:hypothetical protein